MSEAARLIRQYLDKQGGSTEAKVHHLLSEFDVGERDAAGRELIVAQLRDENIQVEPPLDGLDPGDEVVLSAPSRPASERPAPELDDETKAAFMSPAEPEATSAQPEKRRRRWLG